MGWLFDTFNTAITFLMQMETVGDANILHIGDVTEADAGAIRCQASRHDQNGSCVSVDGQCKQHAPIGSIECTTGLAIDQLNCGDAASVSDDSMEGYLSDDLSTIGDEKKQPAAFLRGPQDTSALVGDRVLLKATYIGHPEPTVEWTKAVSFFFFFKKFIASFLIPLGGIVV